MPGHAASTSRAGSLVFRILPSLWIPVQRSLLTGVGGPLRTSRTASCEPRPHWSMPQRTCVRQISPHGMECRRRRSLHLFNRRCVGCSAVHFRCLPGRLPRSRGACHGPEIMHPVSATCPWKGCRARELAQRAQAFLAELALLRDAQTASAHGWTHDAATRTLAVAEMKLAWV